MFPNESDKFCYRIISRLLRIFFNLLYNQFAWIYDFVAHSVSLGMWQDWILSILPFIDECPVLEIGHGPGHLQYALQKKGIQIFGLDASRQMGKMTLNRLCSSGYSPHIVNGIAQSIPFADKTFRSVVSTFPTEYITDPNTLLEIWRILIPGGDVYILPVAWITGKRWFEKFAAWIFRFTKQSSDLYLTDQGAIKHGDFTSIWMQSFQSLGFQCEAKYISLKSSTLMIIHGVKVLSQ